MGRADKGPGPWGEAILHWMEEDNLNNTDLVRLLNDETFIRAWDHVEAELGLPPAKRKKTTAKTLGQIVRGFHTHTRILAKIASALKRPLRTILVMPGRAISDEQRHQIWRQVNEELLTQKFSTGAPREIDEVTLALAREIQALPRAQKQRVLSAIVASKRPRKKTGRAGSDEPEST